MDTSRGFEIFPGNDSGFAVLERTCNGQLIQPMAVAFTNATDMIVWLANTYGVSIAVNEAVKPDLCEDEGCDHHGTEHVCISWTEWGGAGTIPVENDQQVVVKFRNLRTGRGDAKDFYGWNWFRGADADNNYDIVAYRAI